MYQIPVYQEIKRNEILMTILTGHHIPVSDHGKFIQIDGTDVLMQAFVHPSEVTPTRSSIQLDITIRSQNILGDRELTESFGEFGETIDEATNKGFTAFCLASLHPILSVFVSRDIEAEQNQWEQWGDGKRSWDICSGPIIPKGSKGVDLETIFSGKNYLAVMKALKESFLREASFTMHWLRIYRGCFNGEVRGREVLLDGEHWKPGEAILDGWDWQPGADYFSIRQFMIAVPNQHKKQWWHFWRQDQT